MIELGQGGMLDVAASPDLAKDGWIYLAFSDPLEGEKMRAMLKIVRGRIREARGSPSRRGSPAGRGGPEGPV